MRSWTILVIDLRWHFTARNAFLPFSSWWLIYPYITTYVLCFLLILLMEINQTHPPRRKFESRAAIILYLIFLPTLYSPSSMTIKCVKESTENITPSSHNVICWHKPERQQSQKYPPISNQIRHKQKYIFLHFLSVFKSRSLFIASSQFCRVSSEKKKKRSLYMLKKSIFADNISTYFLLILHVVHTYVH